MKISLKIKAVLVVMAFTVLLTFSMVCVSFRTYNVFSTHHYAEHADSITRSTATAVNAEQVRDVAEEITNTYAEITADGEIDFSAYSDSDWNAYYKHFEYIKQMPQYVELTEELDELRHDANVLSLYIGYSDPRSGKNFYIADASYMPQVCVPGDFNDDTQKRIEYLNDGSFEPPPILVNYEEDGWLASSMSPIEALDGSQVGIALADISMQEVVTTRRNFMISVIFLISILSLIMVLITLYLVDRGLLKPIKRLSRAADMFIEGKKNNDPSAVSEFEKLEIKTGDEIETLSNSFKQMERDLNTYISELTSITAEKERIGAELNVARNIQASMLPCIFPPFPDRTEFDIYATMEPAREVGGDFYDLFLIDDDHLAVVIADVSGKGVGAALFMVIAKTMIKNMAQSGLSPSEVFTTVNKQLCENNDEGLFVTAWLGVLETSSGKLTFVNAGHNPPLLKCGDSGFEFLSTEPGFVLAGIEDIEYNQKEITLSEGDYLYLYTDGVTEATDVAGELYGNGRLKKTLDRSAQLSAKELLPAVRCDIDKFVKDMPQFDDITMLALKYRGLNDRSNSLTSITVDAERNNLGVVIDFLEAELDKCDCPVKCRTQLCVAAEEIFVNIASYAYAPNFGKAEISAEVTGDTVRLQFADSGKPYDPLKNDDPDITLAAEEREIGGLGIFIVKKSMDSVSYEYKDGKNILTILKKIK